MNPDRQRIAQLLAGLTPEQRSRFTERLRERAAARADGDFKAAPGPYLPRSKDLPLSYAQQQLWLVDQITPANAAYNIPIAMRLVGRMNAAALEQSFNEVVRRHEILRTAFPTSEDRPVQMIAPAIAVALPMIDLDGLSHEEGQRMSRHLAKEAVDRGFDLARQPLWRALIIRLEPEEYVIVFIIHHITSDEWSTGVLVREMSRLYEAFTKGECSQLPELQVQYADFAIWQRSRMQGQEMEKSLDYWRERLGKAPPMNLPTDRRRPHVQTYHGAGESRMLYAGFTPELKSLARRRGVTMFTALLACFKIPLHHYSGSDDIIVGTGVANRNLEEIEPLIGFFVNQLVLWTNLSGDPSFQEILERVLQVAKKAYDHQDVPFEKVVEVLRPERDLSRNPLFQVMFAFHIKPGQKLNLPDVSLTRVGVQHETSLFDLSLAMTETDRGMIEWWRYNRGLFKSSTVSRLANHFELVLGRVIENPEIKLSALREMLEEFDRQDQGRREQKFKETRFKGLRQAMAESTSARSRERQSKI